MDEKLESANFNEWSLFLDRDGVINKRPLNDYVKSIPEFQFIENVLESISIFSTMFKYIFVVTNQQGVGKQLMSMEELDSIHDYMKNEVDRKGGKIDAIYVAPQLKTEKTIMRKPGVGMGLLAKKEFPEIDFSKSIVVGDALTDMLFGKRLKMKTVFIGNDKDILIHNSSLIDYRFNSLYHFLKYIKQ